MKTLPEWDNRPITVAHLLNPAFCGEIIRRFVHEYQKIKTDNGLPFQLAFLVLPMVLHEGVRTNLPQKSNKNFITWIEENQNIKMLLPNLIRNTIPYTKESIMFLMMYEVLGINDLGEFVIIEMPKAIKTINGVAEYYKKAELVGKWLANSGNSQSIFLNLGIKP